MNTLLANNFLTLNSDHGPLIHVGKGKKSIYELMGIPRSAFMDAFRDYECPLDEEYWNPSHGVYLFGEFRRIVMHLLMNKHRVNQVVLDAIHDIEMYLKLAEGIANSTPGLYLFRHKGKKDYSLVSIEQGQNIRDYYEKFNDCGDLLWMKPFGSNADRILTKFELAAYHDLHVVERYEGYTVYKLRKMGTKRKAIHYICCIDGGHTAPGDCPELQELVATVQEEAKRWKHYDLVIRLIIKGELYEDIYD